MIIYQDFFSHGEMFSNIYEIWEIIDGLCLEMEGKMVSRTEGNIDDSLMVEILPLKSLAKVLEAQ